MEMSAEQAYWLPISNPTSEIPVKIEVPAELLKVSLVNTSLKKLKYHLANFDKVVKVRTTPNAITKVQTVFNQMEAVVEQCSIDKKLFDIQLKESLLTYARLLDQIMSQDIVNIVTLCDVNESVNMSNCVNEKCSKCLEFETELIKKKDMIERDVFDKLSQPPTFNQLFELNELKAQSKVKDTIINKFKNKIKYLSRKDCVENVKKDIDELKIINIELEHSVAKLLSKNENLRKEREHLKSIFKYQFDSIKKTRVQSKEHSDSLIAQINAKSVENSNLNAQLQEKVFAIAALINELRKLKGKNVVDTAVSKPIATTLAPEMFKINLEPLLPKLLKNREAHKDYLKYTQEQAAFLREIVEQGRSLNPLDSVLDYACKYVKRIQELLMYIDQSCPSFIKPSEKLVAVTPMNKDKKVRFVDPLISSSNTQKSVDSNLTKDSNKPLFHSTGVKYSTGASGSKPSGNTKNNRISQPSSSNKTNKVEDQSRSVKSRKNKKNHVDKTECNDHVMQSMLNVNSISKLIRNALAKHSVSNAKFKSICAICNKCLFDANHDMCLIDYVNDVNACSKSKSKRNKKRKVWKPTGKVFTKIGYSWKPIVYSRRPKASRSVGSSSKSTSVESNTSNTKEPKQSWGSTIFDVPSSSLIDCRLSKLLCDLEVDFRKHTYFIQDLEVVDLLKGSKGLNLYTLSLENMMLASPICLLSKASKTKSWLWHRRLSHLNFDYITTLSKQGMVRGLPKIKYQKDHLCSAYALGKSKKHSHKPKAEDTIQEKLYLLHMDLCKPMRIQSINGRKYILVIVDDYSQFTWVKFLRSKDEVPAFTLHEYYEDVGISHQTAVARTPQQNDVVKRRNRTLLEAARTMLIFSNAPLFLWAEAVATACYTQNRSLIHKRYNKTPYELIHDQKPDLSFLHVFGALCYPNYDSEDLGKLKPKVDIGIFVGYALSKKAF
ncbi:retrovirus-related pol polyprotein from transposon TNT 1-94 [Tanacetum coccineum]